MKLDVDLHTHTIFSNHAYCTLREMAKMAQEKGMRILGTSEHTEGVPGACDPFYFMNLKVIPRELYGVKLMLGGELNILDCDGTLSLEKKFWSKMDMRIAGIHSQCFRVGETPEENTRAITNAIANPWVDIICHPDDGRYSFDYEKIVLAAKEHGTLLELNNNAVSPRQNRLHSRENYLTMLTLCKKHGVPILMSSDAHFDLDIGRCDYTESIVEETEFPMDLIANFHPEIIEETIAAKKEKRLSLGLE